MLGHRDDILDYVKLQKAPAAAGQPNPRFSLYLSAMLTHGAVLLHHFQVKNDIGNHLLMFIIIKQVPYTFHIFGSPNQIGFQSENKKEASRCWKVRKKC